MTDKIDLTKLDRLMLANQYKALAKLYPGEADDYERLVQIVENGYASEYAELFIAIDTEISVATCREVLDVLDMHRALRQGFENDPNQDIVSEEEIVFAGYDGNNESEQMSFASYFIAHKGRFEELYDSDDFNTHSPRVESYRAMLECWRNMPESRWFDLTIGEIRQIVDAGRFR